MGTCNRCQEPWVDGPGGYCANCKSCGDCGCCPCNREDCWWCGEHVGYRAVRRSLLAWAMAERQGPGGGKSLAVQMAMRSVRQAYWDAN